MSKSPVQERCSEDFQRYERCDSHVQMWWFTSSWHMLCVSSPHSELSLPVLPTYSCSIELQWCTVISFISEMGLEAFCSSSDMTVAETQELEGQKVEKRDKKTTTELKASGGRNGRGFCLSEEATLVSELQDWCMGKRCSEGLLWLVRQCYIVTLDGKKSLCEHHWIFFVVTGVESTRQDMCHQCQGVSHKCEALPPRLPVQQSFSSRLHLCPSPSQ